MSALASVTSTLLCNLFNDAVNYSSCVMSSGEIIRE
jgi:hypothetical protein